MAVATAHIAGDEELLDALVRDHLADHPDHVLAAWIAARPIPGSPTHPTDPSPHHRPTQTDPSPTHPTDQER